LIKTWVLIKAAFLQLRVYFWSLLGFMAIAIIIDLILNRSLGNGGNSHVSFGSIFIIFIIITAITLPISYFKKITQLGATRKQYYSGLLIVYVLCSITFAVFNIVWMKLEISFNRIYENHTIYILEVFHWDQFGLAGMFLYQFGAYLLLMSILNLLFSGLRHAAGWVIWGILITAIPIGTSLPSLRPKVAEAFLALLFNDSLLKGFGLTLLLSCLFLAGGWWFTSRRTF
jgi:hypothetical protein